MKFQKLVLNPLSVNTYFIYDEVSRESLIVDPGNSNKDEFDLVINFLQQNQLKPKYIVLTHGHFDHLLGAEDLRKALNVKIIAHKKELPIILDVEFYAFLFAGIKAKLPKVEMFVKEGDKIYLGEKSLKVLEVPGHSPGSIALVDDEDEFLVVGDVIFYDSVGRTDIPLADEEQLKQSIKKLLQYECYKILPGHGPETDVCREKAENPYIAMLLDNKSFNNFEHSTES